MKTDGVGRRRGLLGAAQVGDGPTDEQHSIIQHLLHGYFGSDVDTSTLDPIGPDELAARIEPADHKRIVDLLVVLEFCRHPGDPAQADRIEEYVRALGVDEPFMLVARDALVGTQEEVMADWARFREPEPSEAGALETVDAALAAQLRGLGDCPSGSLGRAYFDFYQRWDIAFPGEEGGGDAASSPTTSATCSPATKPSAPTSSRCRRCSPSATGFEHHFSGLVASLSLYEVGKFDILGLTSKVGALDRPGAAAELAEAFRRGSLCSCDFSAIDHMARADDPLDEVRADCGIPELAPA